MGYPNILALEVVLGADQTTVAAGELTALTTTLTNPQNEGIALVNAVGTLKSAGGTVAGDTFDVRLYKDASIICTETVKTPDTNPRIPFALTAVVAIANTGTGTQTLSLRVIRTGGTGTIAVDAGGGAKRSKIAWIFVPNAQVV